MTLAISLALLAGFLFAITNIIDKIIVTKHITRPILLTIFGEYIIPFIGLALLPFASPVLNSHLLIIMLQAILAFCAVTFYFWGMKNDEPSRIVPLLGFITLFVVLLSAIFLGEVFQSITYFGIISIIIGSWIIAAKKNVLSPFKSRVLGIILVSCILWAVKIILDKYLLNYYPPLTILSYQFLFQAPIVLIFSVIYRKKLLELWRKKNKYVMIQWLNQSVAVAATIAYLSAASIWFVALVSATSSVQYLILFLFALILYKTNPDLLGEKVNKKLVFQKLIAIFFIIGGIFIIAL